MSCSVISSRLVVVAGNASKLSHNYVAILGKGPTSSPCFCAGACYAVGGFGSVNWNLKVRHKSTLLRKPVRVYVPERDGIVPARESLGKLPPDAKKNEELQRIKTSGELFKTVMGDIFASRNKRLIAVEGSRQVEDAISFGLKPKMLFLLKSLKTLPENVQEIVDTSQSEERLSFGASPATPEIHRIGLTTLQDWSALKTPPGIIGIFDKPTNIVKGASRKQTLPLTVVLDNVREPGNLGAIMRTAAGIGCEVLLSQGCADPWETKSLRGGNGAQFLVPMITKVDLQHLHEFIQLPELIPLTNAQTDLNADEKGSKNTASGIGVFLADSGTGPDSFGIPIANYTSIQYSNLKSVVLILGGETSGLSETVKKAVNELPQYYPEDIKIISRIKIPMSMPIDSLNVANAFGIIGYEILRQMSNSST